MWTATLALLATLLASPRPDSLPRASAVVGGLEYTEVVTGGASLDEPLPTVVALHGRGGGIAQLRRELERLRTPIRLIVPRGPIRLDGNRRAWFRDPVRHGSSTQLAGAAEGATNDLARLLQHVRRARPTCGEPVVVGWSQGGVLAFLLALERPGLIDRAIVVGGSVPDALVPEHLMPHAPITALHGTRDSRVPYPQTRALAHELQSMGFSVELHPYRDATHQLTAPMRRELRTMIRSRAASLGARCSAT